MGHFSATLSRMRSEAGWRTAYAFYHRNGGRRAFPFTYAYYAKIERGDSLPRPEWVPQLFTFLRILPDEESQRRLIISFLKDLIGKDDLFESWIAPLIRPAEASRPEKRVIKRLLSDQAYHISVEQFQAIVSSSPAYWAFQCLINNHKPLSIEELASATGFGNAELRSAATKLCAQRLARRTTGGKFVSPVATRYCVYPRGYEGYEGDLEKLKAHNETLLSGKSVPVLDSGTTVRTDASSINGIRTVLREVLESASASSVYEKGEDTGMFVIETRIRKIFPF
jgi:hypothetical protein